jgi:hypothetical protein
MKPSANTGRAPEPLPGEEDKSGSGFLRRWAKRKAQVAAPEVGKPVELAGPDVTATVPDAATEAAAPVLTDADMPPIESLGDDSDYSPFFSPGVSEELRQAALRKLFRSASFNELCPLEGEFHDCRGYEPLGSIVTHEMKAQLEREATELANRVQTVLEEEAESLVRPAPANDRPPPAPAVSAAQEAANTRPTAARKDAGSSRGRRKRARRDKC